MTIFSQIRRPSFATRPGDRRPDVPTPHRAKALRRRQVMFREAKELLPYLPEAAGEATHAIMSGRYDLMVLLVAILEKLGGTCQHLRIATLSFNSRNTSEMAGLLSAGKVGALTLLCSAFFRDNNKEEFAATLREAEAFPTGRRCSRLARSVDRFDGGQAWTQNRPTSRGARLTP